MKRWKQLAIAVGVAAGGAVALLTLAFVVGVGMAAMLGVSFAPKTSSDLAGWAQAVGSVAAIAVAWYLGAGQARYTRDLINIRDAAERAATTTAGNLVEHAFITTFGIHSTAEQRGLTADGAEEGSQQGLRTELAPMRDNLRVLANSLDRVGQREHMLSQDRAAVDSASLAAGRILALLDSNNFKSKRHYVEKLSVAHEDVRQACIHFKPDSVFLGMSIDYR